MSDNPRLPQTPSPDKEPIFPSRRKQLFTSSDLKASTIGWEIAIPIFSGPLIGFLIDRSFCTDVRWTMILMGTGLAVAIFSVIKFVNHEMHKMNRELEIKKDELEKLTRGKRIAKHSDKNTP